MMRLFSPTGGLIYHLRALRFKNSAWAPFRQKVSQFLDTWDPPEKKLLILGPSGGHTLPTDFLERFCEVVLSDPDPLAKPIFRRTHPNVRTTWLKDDLIFSGGMYHERSLKNYLAEAPNTAVLFSNLLGQLPLVNDDLDAMKAWWQELQPALGMHSWASYHDLFSTDGADIIDHGTSELFPRSLDVWEWKLSRRRIHIVGAYSYRKDLSGVRLCLERESQPVGP